MSSDRLALVTGTTSGIGEAVARACEAQAAMIATLEPKSAEAA